MKIDLTWPVIRNIGAGIAGTAFFLFWVGQGAVWALEHHFDDRYVIVASTYKSELRKINREIRDLEQSGKDPDYLQFLYEQREQIQKDIDNG